MKKVCIFKRLLTTPLIDLCVEDRALEALPYLETAARSGYEMAFIELYKAHATLARKYISRSKRMSS